MFLATISGCSFLYIGKDSIKELDTKLNKEIIADLSKALSKDPDNFLFYLERGKAKQSYGDFKETFRVIIFIFGMHKITKCLV